MTSEHLYQNDAHLDDLLPHWVRELEELIEEAEQERQHLIEELRERRYSGYR